MSPFARWVRFNVVGALGMGVQLAALACFNRWMHGHYLCASVAAIEVTLVHNFAWHTRYTWCDCRDEGIWWRRLGQFHVSNGVVSMVGSVVVMRVLVHGARLPVLASNGAAVVICSVANFCLAHRWTFAREEATVCH